MTRAGIRTQGGMKALQSPVQKGRQQGEPRGTQRKTARRRGNTEQETYFHHGRRAAGNALRGKFIKMLIIKSGGLKKCLTCSFTSIVLKTKKKQRKGNRLKGEGFKEIFNRR